MNITQGERGYHVVLVAELNRELRQQGWRECIISTPPTPSQEQEGLGVYQPVYDYDEELDLFRQRWEWEQDDTMILAKIEEIKQLLTDTDYIIVKTYEARLVGEEEPYEASFLQSVANQRKQYREDVRKLLSLLPTGTQQRMAISV